MSDALVPLNETVSHGAGGWAIPAVFPASPAEAAGITPDWRLLAIAGTTPTQASLFEARTCSHPDLTFADEGGRVWEWRGRAFPFGAYIVPPVDAAFRRDVRAARPDRQLLVERFGEGDLGLFADLVDDVRRGLSGPQGFLEMLGLGKTKGAEIVPPSDDYEMLGFLGLGYAASRRFSDAVAACTAATEARQRLAQASYSGNTHAIHHVTLMMVAEAQGRRADAVDHISAALASKPEHPFLQSTYKRLKGEAPQPYERVPAGARFPVDYVLPNHDPIGEWPTHGRTLALRSTLAAMEPDQILVVLVLGGYRSNYYANLDIERLSLLHQACAGRMADVHVIVSSDYALDANHRHHAEGLARRFGLPMTLLWDEEETVMQAVGTHMSPVRFCLDHTGRVLSTAPFEEERGLWDAVQTLATRP